MRHSPSEMLEIIRIVEDSELSVRRTLKEMGIHRSTFYNWYRRYLDDGVEGLGPKKPKARTVWNKIPEEVKSESSVYRILKGHDLITSPAYILMQAGDSFKNPTRHIHTSKSYGRQILLTSESLAGVGITCLRFWMISPDTSSPGN